MQRPTPQQIREFQEVVLTFYAEQGRALPWRTPSLGLTRGRIDPYPILVSEIMLQQTQVNRVIPKFQEFMGRFPTVASLAAVDLAEVIRLWNGLGYNRRARFLWLAAQMVVAEFGGHMPADVVLLQRLPGVGVNTAAAIATYAYNQPQVFIETNIRSVYIHHFFLSETLVDDADIRALVALTLPDDGWSDYIDEAAGKYRTWYWALMDYGSYLKQTAGNAARASRHYTKQSKFEGSRRQIRGAVLRSLALESHDFDGLHMIVNDDRLAGVLDDLVAEGMIQKHDGRYSL